MDRTTDRLFEMVLGSDHDVARASVKYLTSPCLHRSGEGFVVCESWQDDGSVEAYRVIPTRLEIDFASDTVRVEGRAKRLQ